MTMKEKQKTPTQGLCTTTTSPLSQTWQRLHSMRTLRLSHLHLASRAVSPNRSIGVSPMTRIGPLSCTYNSKGEANELTQETFIQPKAEDKKTRSKYVHNSRSEVKRGTK